MMETRRSTSCSDARGRATSLAALLLLSVGCPTAAPDPDPTPEPTPAVVGEPHDPGPPYFEDVTDSAGIGTVLPGSAVAAADIDGDGWTDLYYSGRDGGQRLFRNLGNGQFEDVTDAWMPADTQTDQTVGATFADTDNDGDPDLLLGSGGQDILLGNLGYRFEDISNLAGIQGAPTNASGSWALADYDRDGDLDAYVTGGVDGGEVGASGPEDTGLPDRLYRNDGGNTFTDVSALMPEDMRRGVGFIAGWTDTDQDGDEDLYIVNDIGFVVPNRLFRNDGPDGNGGWVFTPLGEDCGCMLREAGMGLAIGDFDRDGLQDLYTSNGANPFLPEPVAEVLLRNEGDNSFVDVSLAVDAHAGGEERISSWGLDFLDVDNDGWLDVFIPFGHPAPLPLTMPEMDALMKNRGGTFEVVEDAGVGNVAWAMSAAVLDFDHDGCLDLAVNYMNEGESGRLFRNLCATTNLSVELTLRGTASNRDAVGAVAIAQVGDLVLREEVLAGSSSVYASRWKTLHFGLGGHPALARLEIQWPSGRVDVFEDVTGGRRYALVEGDASLTALD